MVEVLGVAASVVGMVGFAGQVLQGCQYICTIFDNAKDAPEDIKSFGVEVKLFYYMLSSFQKALTELESVGGLEDMKDEIKLALVYSDEAVTKLKKLVMKCEVMIGAWWKRVLHTTRKEQFAKQVARIERAKGYIGAAQNNINLRYTQKQSVSAQQIGETVTSMNQNLATSNDIISTIPGAFRDFRSTVDDTHNAVDAMREELAGMIRTVMDQILDPKSRPFGNAITTTEVRFEEQQWPCHDGLSSHSIRESSSHSTTGLPYDVIDDVKATFIGVLVEFQGQSQKIINNEAKQVTGENLAYEDDRAIATHTKSLRRGCDWKVLRQDRRRKSYERKLGKITVRSITQICEENTACLGNDAKKIFAWTQTYIDLIPNANTLDFGVCCSILYRGFTITQSSIDPVLRFYNAVDWDAPVVQACLEAQVSMLQYLFSMDEASPFDRIQGGCLCSAS